MAAEPGRVGGTKAKGMGLQCTKRTKASKVPLGTVTQEPRLQRQGALGLGGWGGGQGPPIRADSKTPSEDQRNVKGAASPQGTGPSRTLYAHKFTRPEDSHPAILTQAYEGQS